jgi:hypothetical protein
VVKGIEARVVAESTNWATGTVRLLVRDADRGRPSYLMEDGTWKEADEGTSPVGMGLILPAESVEAIARAVEEFQGHASHSDTEARVLREWLAVERGRVDLALGRTP